MLRTQTEMEMMYKQLWLNNYFYFFSFNQKNFLEL